MTINQRTSHVLNKAADLIQERGWAKVDGWFSEPGDTTPLCIEGAIAAAVGHDNAARCDTIAALKVYLNFRPHMPYSEHVSAPFMWNDMECEGGPHAVEVLRAAALIESARESQDAAFATYAQNVAAS